LPKNFIGIFQYRLSQSQAFSFEDFWRVSHSAWVHYA
jgi:hypothetical protein